jgi:hypothetical protein
MEPINYQPYALWFGVRMSDGSIDPISRSALELIERHGSSALAIARDRAQELAVASEGRAHDAALCLLTRVEQLLDDLSALQRSS